MPSAGMGAITQAMAKECAARGVVLRTDAAVRQVLVRDGRASASCSRRGEEVRAERVVANVTPRVLYRRARRPRASRRRLPPRIAGYRCASGTFRMNVALSRAAGLPSRCPARHAQPHHASGIIVAPSLGYMERAYFDARTLGWSREPIVEMLIPSVVDETLAPAGMHVASLFCQHANPELPAVTGRTWDDAKDEVADLMIATVDRVAPNFAASVLGRRVLSPLDLEREFGLTGGRHLPRRAVARPALLRASGAR